MTTNPKTNGNGARSGMSYAAAGLTVRDFMRHHNSDFTISIDGVPDRALRLDYLAARAIRYELRGGHPDRQDDRRQELEEASRAACAEWRALRWPGGMPEGEEEWVREGWES